MQVPPQFVQRIRSARATSASASLHSQVGALAYPLAHGSVVNCASAGSYLRDRRPGGDLKETA
jgi:hypothetical protein